MSNQPSSLLQHALQNLHVSSQPSGSLSRPTSLTGHSRHWSADPSRNPPTPNEEGDDVLVGVGQDTRAPTRVPSRLPSPRLVPVDLPDRDRGGKGPQSRDPLRVLPTQLAVRVFLQLDIRALAKCDRVCKRWHKSSTLNYVWYLQNRSLLLPHLITSGPEGKIVRRGDDTPDFFDPYDKSPRLASLPVPALPPSAEPVWTKLESRKSWKTLFRGTLKRSDPRQDEEEDHPYHVNVESLHTSGTSTPNGRGHSYAGMGSGHAARWVAEEGTAMTPTERKIAAREGYKGLGGRKSKAKRKVGMEIGRDKGGGEPDDGRFDAPW